MTENRVSPEITNKYNRLKAILQGMQRALVAFSGGVDSTFLLKTAHDVLKENVLAVTNTSEIHPLREEQEAVKFARELHIPHLLIHGRELDDPDFIKNSPERCYLCKKGIFSQLKQIAEKEGIPHILDGENADDSQDYRPGSRATKELGVRSPLREVGFSKEEVRSLSRELGLYTWNKPSLACLASRFPYGTEIDRKSLDQVDRAEEYLRSLGFSQLRVRHHGPLARIELLPEEISRVLDPDLKGKIEKKFKEIGYTYVTLDLTGYRTGSLNEILVLNGKI